MLERTYIRCITMFLICIGLFGIVLYMYKDNVVRTPINLSEPKYKYDKLYCDAEINMTCHYYFSDQIKSHSVYRDLILFLNMATKGTTVKLYLTGNGGLVESVIRIVNAVRETDAEVVAIVVGGTASGHSFIALGVPNIIIHEGVFFMFHKGATSKPIEDICGKYIDKTDRGQNSRLKCLNKYKTYQAITDNFLLGLVRPVLSDKEIQMMKDGHDIYITGHDMIQRLENEKNME